ncbi:leucine-rich melanocyte differentiation-associated protein [Anastrepha ludens]|uniref:leucine-rich melanocyte differentiation-associated protein n=1 Tax=Anastrepha ludens TaxID=28586 RepID=UPI0023B16953|nr:leucine-rich melanocyte differentiation-associated protein [Anastrepha ludens]
MFQPTTRYDAQHRELILAHCHYEAFPPQLIAAFGERTEYLDCSHNRLMNLSYLYEFTNLKYLILDNNRLHEAHFNQLKTPLPKVKLLMLNRNELMDLQRTITLLADIFPNLEYLSLHGNPICPDQLELQPFSEYADYEYDNYRSQISSAFSKLKFLDHYDMQRSYFNLIPQPTKTYKHQNTSKLFSLLKFSNFNFGKLSKLRTFGLIQKEEPERDCSITDEEL